MTIQNNDLTFEQRELLEQCGADAQDHPLELDGKVLRFKADPFTRFLLNNFIDLNILWAELWRPGLHVPGVLRSDGDDIAPVAWKPIALGVRKFYRDIGYSLCGYIEIFGETLDKEEKNATDR